jgi:hypothetical protein
MLAKLIKITETFNYKRLLSKKQKAGFLLPFADLCFVSTT